MELYIVSLIIAVVAGIVVLVNEYLGYFILMIAWLFVSASHPDTNEMKLLEQAQQQIEECQKELPRNQVCELKAVPIVKEDK